MSLTMINHSEKELIWDVVLSVLSILAFVAMFSIGMGPIPSVYNSEIFPLRLRAQGVSFGVAINRLISGVMSMTFISLYKAITIGEAFLLFMGVAMLGWLFFYTLIPETQGKTLEEMQMLFGTFFKGRSTMRELKKNKERVRSTDDR
ncbi:Polyol transporter 5 [Camellia lanceoleosa]|uniref:Polyol transporter 5 n=1 Tax=Camellia lanceoleosa TaxID=1840588 RepID=A0ACC0HW69_9ERIC|nr:Polyol transporter 5 [Camellia lanceoleosa]